MKPEEAYDRPDDRGSASVSPLNSLMLSCMQSFSSESFEEMIEKISKEPTWKYI